MLVCSNWGALERWSGANVTAAMCMSRLCNGFHNCCVNGGEVKCVNLDMHMAAIYILEGAPVAAYKHAMQLPGDTHARVRLGYVFVL